MVAPDGSVSCRGDGPRGHYVASMASIHIGCAPSDGECSTPWQWRSPTQPTAACARSIQLSRPRHGARWPQVTDPIDSAPRGPASALSRRSQRQPSQQQRHVPATTTAWRRPQRWLPSIVALTTRHPTTAATSGAAAAMTRAADGGTRQWQKMAPAAAARLVCPSSHHGGNCGGPNGKP